MTRTGPDGEDDTETGHTAGNTGEEAESPPPTDADSSSDDHSSLSLPVDARGDLKDPFGPIETDADVLLASVSGPLVAVGDVVTYHFLQAGHQPDVALVDGRTKRSAVDEEIERAVTDGVNLEVENPPGVITEELVGALVEALVADDPITILVDGEEDLAALPAIVAAPAGASVVYGQPDEGMVHVRVDDDVRSRVRALLERFEGEGDAIWALLEDA
ncbi:GTP-dependent dephospho-CoA kinase family protein [Halostagnicola sp. A-GB9-2]|uniref:GTP-dependent dephospho-CoA kinase family protein n=1 Tax=Halostagnicola sp. A-GB9-2 TaxID=3048066 RepID=UPI0024BF39EC|nr:GTP-dependent dephospho-CoA kinase family protein [Halostagnicola sp. A-GB9-2]MDJ1432200.1 GTP-dependent dephospho-CoA kinase family protein [Halostagnicola sp. A-GB9-2]